VTRVKTSSRELAHIEVPRRYVMYPTTGGLLVVNKIYIYIHTYMYLSKLFYFVYQNIMHILCTADSGCALVNTELQFLQGR